MILGLGSIQVDRKLVKQTVMTSVYGVTYVGAREQIKRRLEERGLIDDEKLLYRVSCYAAKVSILLSSDAKINLLGFNQFNYNLPLITQVTLAALEEMFQSARGIMSWLTSCAKVGPSGLETT